MVNETGLDDRCVRNSSNRAIGGNATHVHPPLLGLIVLAVTVSPRIDLVSVGASTIRLEDVVLASLVAFTRSNPFSRRIPGGRWMAAVTSVALLSVLWNALEGRLDLVQGILFALRPLEYWLIFVWLVNRHLHLPAQRKRLDRILALVTVTQLAVALVQAVLGISIGFSKFSNQRAAGLTAGPYELGAIMSLFFIYWLARGRPMLAGVSLCAVVLSASRISVLATLLGALVFVLVRTFSRRGDQWRGVSPRFVAGMAIALSIPLGASIVTTPEVYVEPVVERIQTTDLIAAWSDAGARAHGIAASSGSDEYLRYAYSPLYVYSAVSSDQSASIRFFRWRLLLNLLGEDFHWMMGLGPSFAGPSVDGGVMRVVAELGAVGFAMWAGLFVSMYRSQSAAGRGILVALLTGSLFIDLPFAMRVVMVLLVLMACELRVTADPDRDREEVASHG